jgi:magnesium chelatase accessory protein
MQTDSFETIPGLSKQVLRLHHPWPLLLSCWVRPARPGAPCLLLLHGTGSNHASFTSLCQKLPIEIGLMVPDLPGHGESTFDTSPTASNGLSSTSPQGFGLLEMSQWLEAMLDQLQASPDLIVGHSAGAAVAFVMALEQPERAVLGLAPSLVPPPSIYNSLVGPWLGPMVRSGPSLAFGHWLAGQAAVIDRLLASTASAISETQRIRYRQLFESKAHLAGTLAFMAGTDLPGLLANPKLKRLDRVGILSAKDDPWIPARSLQDILSTRLAKAKVKWLDHGGHLFHETDAKPVLDFITELTRP